MFSIGRLYHALAANAREGRWQSSPSQASALRAPAVDSILSLPVGDHPEGVAVDQTGNVYVSNRRFVGPVRQAEILKVSRDGTATVVARLPDTTDPQGNGVLGLATGRGDNIYAALDSRDPQSRGVWRIHPDGSRVERLAGSEGMSFPNALIFDANGNLYATDSATGAIWRFPPADAGAPAAWTQDELLAPFSFDPFGIPLPDGRFEPFGLPGANGIAYYPPDHLYVANTEKALLVHVSIESNGSAGPARIVAGAPIPSDPLLWQPEPRLWTMDGIAVDVGGNVFGVVPGALILTRVTGRSIAPLVRIDARSGEIVPVSTRSELFDTPLSLAFGRSGGDLQRVYVTNSALLPEVLPGPGAGLICVEVGVPGFHVEAGPGSMRVLN